MSERNGDRARFQKNRKRKLNQRERTRGLIAARSEAGATKAAGDTTSADSAAEPSAGPDDTTAAGPAE